MLKTFSRTDIGRKRKLNQDYIYTSESFQGNLPNVFIVADGMGGHAAGDFASRLAVESMVHAVEEEQERDPALILRKGVEAANRNVYISAMQDSHLEGMGTTMVAACVEKNVLHVANVGDSRLYLVRDREIRQITRDHSLVEEMVRQGVLSEERARSHPDKNKITRAVGVKPDVEPDLFREELESGDTVLLCTDGLTNMLEDEEIRVLIRSARDVMDAVIRLVDAANAQGGRDNISVVLIRYEE